jgi:NTE family protein
MRKLQIASSLLVIFWLCSATRASGQAAPQPQASPPQALSSSPSSASAKRLKVGIALEGGGALGLAHIGVLQWFEDHHIPIDYVAGTSMGGLVGGLYATGKSPAELKAIVEEQNWDFIVGGELHYEDLSFRRKEDYEAYPNRLEFGLKKGFSLPSGLNAGQGVSSLIDRETLAYTHNAPFDDLPIPFRCVATNLTTGKAFVFDHGSIAEAMRATMSIPGVFAPVRDGDNIYVDGGLLGNLPTDVVRKMGADIVIAVHLEIAPSKPEDIQSLFSVLGRSVEVVIHENEIRGLAGADLVVNVDLKDFSSMDYQKAETIIARGAQAAEEKSHVFLPYSLNDADWSAHLSERKSRIKTQVPVPQFVKVHGTNDLAARQLERFLQPLVGKPIDPETMDHFLNRLAGIGKYDSADYWLLDRDGQTGLIVGVHEKSYAPPTVNLAFDVDGSETKNVTFTQTARLTLLDVAGYRSEWRTDFSFGNTYAISSELYRPFNPVTKWFVAPHATASDSGLDLYAKSDPIALYRFRKATIGFDLGYGFSRFTELRAGYDTGHVDAELSLGTPEFVSLHGRVGDTHIHILTDHTDDPIVPRSGYSAEAAFHFYDAYPGSFTSFPAADGHVEYFQPVDAKGSLFASGEAGTLFGTHYTGFPQYFIGGPLQLSAYGTNELFGQEYFLVRGGYLRELATLPPFAGKKVYIVTSYEMARISDIFGESRLPVDVAAGVLAETAFGPFFVGGSVGDAGHQKWFFRLGKVF